VSRLINFIRNNICLELFQCCILYTWNVLNAVFAQSVIDFCKIVFWFVGVKVLAQQRAEQSRLSADQNRESNDAPLDPASFIQSLPASLRQQVLADMDDSMVAVLPSDLAAEANVLRREVEERHRRLVQERLFAQGAGLLSGILRHSGIPSWIINYKVGLV